VRYNRREKTGGQQSQVSLSAPKAAEPSTMPFAQRLTCTIDDACEVTGLGRTKLYELRASAIEIACSHDVQLKDNILLAILPKQYLEEDGDNPNHDFMARLKSIGIPWEVYDWQANTTPNEFQEEIAKIAKKFLQKQGLL